jgi:hypothetical protein
MVSMNSFSKIVCIKIIEGGVIEGHRKTGTRSLRSREQATEGGLTGFYGFYEIFSRTLTIVWFL